MQNVSSVYFFKQPLHVSGVSIAHHQEVHYMAKTISTYCSFYMAVCCPGWVPIQPGQQTDI